MKKRQFLATLGLSICSLTVSEASEKVWDFDKEFFKLMNEFGFVYCSYDDKPAGIGYMTSKSKLGLSFIKRQITNNQYQGIFSINRWSNGFIKENYIIVHFY